MLKNYIILAYRHLKRKKGFAFINIAGMGVSLTVVLVILQFVIQELSFDNFHEKGERMYRVIGTRTVQEREMYSAPGSASLLPVEVAKQIPELESFVRMDLIDYTNVSLTNREESTPRQIFQGNFFLADSTFFDVFSFQLLRGSEKEALSKAENMVITRSVAEKLFDSGDPMGKTVEMGNNWGIYQFQVSGVMEDAPFNSHLSPKVIVPLTFYDKIGTRINDWEYGALNSYLVLQSSDAKEKVETAFNSIYQQFRPEKLKNQGVNFSFALQPLHNIHLDSSYQYEVAKTGNRDYVLFISIVGGLILVISWVNYVNLSTAQSVERAKEVGVRKVFGSQRIHLISQFLLESLLVNGISVAIALTLAQTLLQRVGSWTGIDIQSTLIANPFFWGGLVAFWFLSSLLAGFYPAFVLSGYKAGKVLGGRFKSQGKGIFLRRSLVVFQFAISTLLIAGTITVYRQISFMRSQELGMNISDVLVLKSPPAPFTDHDFSQKVNYFKTELLRNPQFAAMTTSSTVPGHTIGWTSTKVNRKAAADASGLSFSLIACDKDYLKALSINLAAGEFFKGTENPWATGEIVINRKAAELLGFTAPQDAINQRLTCPVFRGVDLKIIGVTNDYHHEALKASITPVIYALSSWSNYYMVKMNLEGGGSKAAALQASLGTLENAWKESFPQTPFDYAFLDEQFNRQYKEDAQFGTLFSLFAGFAIFIGCLGLFGLASYTLYQRTKEIGIRKVLGASYTDITLLVSREFLALVLVGNALAIPAGWWLSGSWLEDYAYRISLGWWFVAIPLLSLAALTMLTIVFQILKAVKLNPVESLRYE